MADQAVDLSSDPARPWSAVSALLLGAFVSLLDVTVVNLAIPEIARDLKTTGTQAQWVLLAYVLPLAALLLPMGRFGDALGRRRLFLTGIVVFTLGACFAGFAQSISTLIIARTIQGIGAATMMPQVLALIQVILPSDQRRRAMGYFAMVSALGAIAGPIIGGVVLEVNFYDLGWRIVFLMVLPPCAVSVLIAAWCLDKDVSLSRRSIDLWHGLMIAMAIAFLVFAATQGRVLGWPFWLMALFTTSLLLLRHVFRAQLKGRPQTLEPLLPQDLLHSREFVRGTSIILILFCGIAGIPFLLALALQAGPQMSPGTVALTVVVHPVLATLGAFLAGRVAPGNHWVLPMLGSMTTFGGTALLALIFWWLGNEVSATHLLVPLAMVGFGMGLSNVALMSFTLAAAPKECSGAASGVLQTAQQIGIALSIAIVGGLYFGHTHGDSMQAATVALLFSAGVFAVVCILCIAAVQSHRRGIPS
ncbi:MFS transporter [Roseibium sp. MMSF_3412]|uniref:MFS transporter n=1 Tax=Roseibium sp. MMSF_3412 TaxID=3046712 RepID=UPI00273E539E|nr:MFS transporter [Roseibium sp. MMSF_3412]